MVVVVAAAFVFSARKRPCFSNNTIISDKIDLESIFSQSIAKSIFPSILFLELTVFDLEATWILRPIPPFQIA